MAKKILAIFFVSILLCSHIIPTTSAFADVVIGDNDSIVVTQQGIENGKKIATMEAMLQLLESGVSEINFNDISDLDDYLEDFYDELTNVNYQDVSNEFLAGAYNDVKSLKQWIDDRGEYIATYYKDMLNSADQGLSDIFNRFNLKLEKTSLTTTPLNGFRGMSRFNGDNTPSAHPLYQQYIDKMNGHNPGQFFWYNAPSLIPGYKGNKTIMTYPFTGYSWIKYPFTTANVFPNGGYRTQMMYCTNVIDLYIYYDGTYYSGSVNNLNAVGVWMDGAYQMTGIDLNYDEQTQGWYMISGNNASISNYSYSYSNEDLGNVLDFFASHIKNANLYVNGEPWSIVSTISAPTIDIDGFLKMYGNDNPVEYEFPQGTKIDYNALYTTIYNAIRDNLPLDMETINNNQVYYDSHDTVYSPTIYNYYGKDGDDENDWIDSILDYATIPDFNAVLGTVAVLDAPFVNGITIVNAGVTDVIPTDILLILGGFFVLVLFVCIINRMSE